MRLRLRLIPPDKVEDGGVYLNLTKVLGTVNDNQYAVLNGPGTLEYLDDESRSWVPVEIDSSSLVIVEVDDIREMPGEVPIQVPTKN